jgi:hypothetical protein
MNDDCSSVSKIPNQSDIREDPRGTWNSKKKLAKYHNLSENGEVKREPFSVEWYPHTFRRETHLQSDQKPPTLFFPGPTFFRIVGGRLPKGPGATWVLTAGTYESQ